MSRRQMLALSAGAVLSTAGLSCRRAAMKPGEKPNIIVVLSDTLRADHLGCQGYGVQTSPAIDHFSEQAVVFEQCYSQSPWTKPSIGSIYTGLLPSVHQAAITSWDIKHIDAKNVQVLRGQFTTLAENLKAVGYHTALFLSNPHVQKQFGFAGGFDEYQYVLSWNPQKHMDAVLDWLDEKAEQQPFFVFIHIVDPHGPYTPPEGTFRALFGTTPQAALDALPEEDKALLHLFKSFYNRQSKDKAVKRPPLQQLTPEGLAFLKRLYDGEIAFVDLQFARLVHFLKRRRLFDRTAVVLTSDHGESFNEHGYFHHGNCLFDEELHVPLIIRLPEMRRPVRVPYTVSGFDLYPTLASIAGGDVPEYLQGKALLSPEGNVTVTQDSPVFSELDYYRPETEIWDASMILGAKKVMSRNSGEKLLLFDRAADPEERKDRFSGDAVPIEGAEALRARFEAARREHAQLAATFGPPEWTQAGDSLREEIESMGYMM